MYNLENGISNLTINSAWKFTRSDTEKKTQQNNSRKYIPSGEILTFDNRFCSWTMACPKWRTKSS